MITSEMVGERGNIAGMTDAEPATESLRERRKLLSNSLLIKTAENRVIEQVDEKKRIQPPRNMSVN